MIKTIKSIFAVIIAITAFITVTNKSNAQIETDVYTNYISVGNTQLGSSSCPGYYYGYTKLTNSDGQTWITPPAGATNCVESVKPLLSYATLYSLDTIEFANLTPYCDEIPPMTFDVDDTTKYTFLVYVRQKGLGAPNPIGTVTTLT